MRARDSLWTIGEVVPALVSTVANTSTAGGLCQLLDPNYSWNPSRTIRSVLTPLMFYLEEGDPENEKDMDIKVLFGNGSSFIVNDEQITVVCCVFSRKKELSS